MPLDEGKWKLIQQLALLAYVHKGEDSKTLYKAVVGAKVVAGLWSELSGKSTVKAYRNEAILAIAQFIKDHPDATEKEIQDEVENQVQLFVDKIK